MREGAGPGLSLRPAGPADAPAMAAILNAVIAEGDKTAIPGPVTEAQIALYYLTGPDCRGCTLALAEGTPAGFQSLDVHHLPGTGWADIRTFVAARARGAGAGRALWGATLELARARGLAGLRAVIRSVNRGAIAYYSGCGFAPPGPDLPAVLADLPADRTVLVRPLP